VRITLSKRQAGDWHVATTQQDQTFSEATRIFERSVDSTNFLLDLWWLWLLVIVVMLALFKLRGQHALLGELDERCSAAFGDIDAILAERHELIPNLIATTKGFAAQEHKVLSDVIDARARAMASAGNARLEAELQVGQSLNNLWAITENYPDLASSTHFRELRAEMVRMEDRINAARKFYNLSVEELNAVRRSFPYNLIDGLAKTARHEKFSLGEKRAQYSEPVVASF
jgi:LemA protein